MPEKRPKLKNTLEFSFSKVSTVIAESREVNEETKILALLYNGKFAVVLFTGFKTRHYKITANACNSRLNVKTCKWNEN